MKVEEGAVVSLIYKVKDEDGQVIDDNREASPLEYLHGHGNIISGLEGALDGVEKGERLEVTVEPEEAYGQPNPEAVFGMPRDRFPDDMDVEAGMQLSLIHISEPTRLRRISYAVFCLKKKNIYN